MYLSYRCIPFASLWSVRRRDCVEPTWLEKMTSLRRIARDRWMFGLDLFQYRIPNRGRLVFTVVALLSEVFDLISVLVFPSCRRLRRREG